MGKKRVSVGGQTNPGQESNLLQALNAAAAFLQGSARSKAEVFQAFNEQSVALGLQGGISLFDDSGQNFVVKALAYNSRHIRIFQLFAERLNLNAVGYTFPIERSEILHQVILNKQPVYIASNTEVIRQVLPAKSRHVAGRLLFLLGGRPAIFAPIITGDTVQGILNFIGEQLSEKDIPAVQAFANHIAIALENAQLISELRATEARQRLLFNEASDGIFIHDAAGFLIDVNTRGCLMLGFSRQELLGKHFTDLIDAVYLDRESLPINEFFTDKKIVIERQLIRKDGSTIDVEISRAVLPDGEVQGIIRDISARIHSEQTLRRREAILEAIAFAAGRFLRQASWENGIEEVLSRLGKAADVSRVYIFENSLNESGTLCTSHRYEWTAPGIQGQIENLKLQNMPYEETGFGRWTQILGRGENIWGHIESFPEGEQAILKPQGILSILAVPIFDGQSWWGLIGFDECNQLRDWDAVEIDSLQAAAGTISAAIERQRIDQEERRRRQEAETLIQATTALTSTLNLDQVLNIILSYLQQAVPFTSACIFLLNDNVLRPVAGYGLPVQGRILNQLFSAQDDVLVAQMRETKRPVILRDARQEPGFNAWGETKYVRGWMGVPLLTREKVAGYVTLDSTEVGAYGEAEARLAQAFVNQAAIAIENAQLFAETQRLLGQTQEQTHQLQQIMNIVPDGILLLDSQKQIVSINQAGESYLEQLATISENRKLLGLGPYSPEALFQPTPAPPPWKELEVDGGKHIFEAAAWPLNPNARHDYWVLVIQDITEERHQQSYRAAQERLAIVGQLAAGIAHDFNNIMAVILLYTQMLLKTSGLPPTDEKRLLTIQQQTQRAAELIHQILDFSRRSILEKKPVDFLPFLDELTTLLSRTLPENIGVVFNSQDGHYLTNGDPARLQQVIMNLALNARDAMPDGGSLHITLTEALFLDDQVRPFPDMTPGDWLKIVVSDTGNGIGEGDLPHIFEPFFTTKAIGQGTGLGLAQVYGIIKQHGGFIDVQSQLNAGTTFTIYLPVFWPTVEILPDQETPWAIFGNQETILVVEDDESAREAVVEILEMLNYRALAAAHGAEALGLFEEYKEEIALVLSDMVMPVMDGNTLYDRLIQIRPEVKMVVMTGYPLKQTDNRLLREGMVARIQKPLDLELIAQTIHKVLNDSHDT